MRNTKFTYTMDMIEETRRCLESPHHFIRTAFTIQHPIKGTIPFETFAFQEMMVESYVRNPRSIVLAGRQMGTTSVVTAYLLWYALFNPYKTIGIVSDRLLIGQETLARIMFAYDNLPLWMKPALIRRTQTEVQFDNDSRIFVRAMSEHSFRGMAVNVLFIDDFGFTNDEKARGFWAAHYPVFHGVAEKVIITSTWNGSGNLFATLWNGAVAGENGFSPLHMPWWRHPERDEAWAQTFRERLGSARFDDDFECVFR